MQVGKILHDNYLIDKELGAGGMGVVYLARHKMMAKKFAIKSLRPELAPNKELRTRFLAELNTHSQMEHQNIVQVTDCFEENDLLYVVMEYISGCNLDTKIKEEGRIKELDALNLMRQILEAMQYAHQKNIIHRDIKPLNILIGEDGRPRVTDFGIAIVSNVSRLTRSSSQAIGTACYMSPEQIKTPLEIDHRSDIYALGILLYEMLTGEVPFDGDTEFVIQDQHVNRQVPNPHQRYSDISEAAARIIIKAMEKDRAKRYQSCAEFIQDIDKIIRPKAKLPLWKIIALSLVLTAAIYPFLPERFKIDPKQQHDTAFAMIEASSEQSVIFCTKNQELPLKKEALGIAEQNGFFDLVDAYKKQINDIETTLEDSRGKYVHFVNELKKIPADIVKDEFDRYKNQLEQTGRSNQTAKATQVLLAMQTEEAIEISQSCQ